MTSQFSPLTTDEREAMASMQAGLRDPEPMRCSCAACTNPSGFVCCELCDRMIPREDAAYISDGPGYVCRPCRDEAAR